MSGIGSVIRGAYDAYVHDLYAQLVRVMPVPRDVAILVGQYATLSRYDHFHHAIALRIRDVVIPSPSGYLILNIRTFAGRYVLVVRGPTHRKPAMCNCGYDEIAQWSDEEWCAHVMMLCSPWHVQEDDVKCTLARLAEAFIAPKQRRLCAIL